MKYNTRFNPTPTGPLHIGHLYMALVNEAEAHRSGGKFIVRVNDIHMYWTRKLGKELLNQYSKEYQEQLSRFMTIDVWDLESLLPTPEEIIGEHPLLDMLPRPRWWGEPGHVIEWRTDINQQVWDYSPRPTFEKVVWDFHEGINLLIRGEDIVTEANLYSFFEAQLGFLRPHQIYLPRLMTKARQELTEMGISKTYGTYQLKTQLDKFGQKEVLNLLKKSCLIEPEGEFFVENIKWNPTAEGFDE